MSNTSKFVVALGIIVVLALLAFGVYRINKPATPRQTTPPLTLLDYIKRDSQVRFTIEGPVNANEAHNSIQVTVNKDNRVIEVLRTYATQVTTAQTFANNQTAYEDFMTALNNAGYIKRNQKKPDSEIGACPTGQRYIYELIDGGNTVTRLWSSTCGDGNFSGNANTVRTLFQAQIAGYFKIAGNVNFSPQQ
jgi:hypothetical protein